MAASTVINDASKPSSSAAVPSSSSSIQQYLEYLELLYSPSAWSDAPRVPITYRNLSYIIDKPVTDTSNPSIAKAAIGLFHKPATEKFSIYRNVSGHIESGKMTLLLAPPGAGKSQLLKTFAGHQRYNPNVTGELLFDGLSRDEQLKAGIYTEKLCALIAQGDIHMANLTVKEALQFAFDNSVVDLKPELFQTNNKTIDASKRSKSDYSKLLSYHQKKVDLMIDVLGMQECAHTIAGNEMVRGISGGQAKRLTIGELLISNARVLILDEPTTGLDAAVARDLLTVLKRWCELSGGTVIAAILQATPECYSLFDDVMMMKDGDIVYHGPRMEVEKYMEQYWGIFKPLETDSADFIVDVLTNPQLQLTKQQKLLKKGILSPQFGGKLRRNTNLKIMVNDHHNEEARPVILHDGDDDAYKNNNDIDMKYHHDQQHQGQPAAEGQANPLLFLIDDSTISQYTTDYLVECYQSSPYYHHHLQNIEKIFEHRKEINKDLSIVKKNRSEYTLLQYGQLYTKGFKEHTKLSLKRQFTLLMRDKQISIPRCTTAIIMSLIFGSLFYQLDIDQFYAKMGIILFTLMNFSMGNFTELPATFEGRNTVYKQIDAGMYPSLSYIISTALASIPIILVESILFCVILYHLVGLADGADHFFYFWLIMAVTDFFYSALFRMICFKVVSIDGAQQVSMPIMNIMMVYSGFLILKPSIKDWQIEFYWLSPFSWGVRALCSNEFSSSAYDAPLPDTNIRRGDFYMKSFGMSTDKNYLWAAPIYILFLSILCILVGARWLDNTRFDLLQGTKRIKQHDKGNEGEEKKDNNNNNNNNGAIVIEMGSLTAPTDNHSTPPSASRAVGPAPPVPPLAPLSLARQTTDNEPSQSVLPFQPANLTFSNIHYTVFVDKSHAAGQGHHQQDNKNNNNHKNNNEKNNDNNNNKKKGGKFGKVEKKLLTDISGYVQSGQLVALMGSSGSGKTTLMDVISGRKTTGIIKGEIRVNGVIINKDNDEVFRRLSGYCEQRDNHMPLATVRESLLFSAALRLPKTVTKQQREEFVEEILEILELKPLADRIVGNDKYTGLSPGQLKLLTIGVELAANPSILFLDEPTSGLDSRAAVIVMRVCRRIARTGRSVFCTVHQPSQDVFFYFDAMLLLRRGGRAVFFGELGSEAINLVNYFQSIKNKDGIYPKKPNNMNPASWMLDVIGAGLSMHALTGSNDSNAVSGEVSSEDQQALITEEKKQANQDSHRTNDIEFDYAIIYHESELYSKAMNQLTVLSNKSVEIKIDPNDYNVPLSRQIYCVVERGLISMWRDSNMNFGRLIMLIFIALIFGIVYIQLDEGTFSGLTSKQSAVFSVAGFFAMLSASTVLPAIFSERIVYYREQAARAYPSWIYSTTIGITEIPVIFVSTLVGAVIFYFLVGFKNDASLFFQFYLSVSLIVLIQSSFGQFAAAMFPNFVVAIQLAGALNMLFFLFGGLFIRPADIPVYYQWFYYLNPIPKSIMAIVLPQFECHLPNPYDKLSGCPTVTNPANNEELTTHRYIAEQWNSSYDNLFARMVGWLLVTYGVFRVGLFLALKYIIHLKR